MTEPKLLFELLLVRHAQSLGNAGLSIGDTAADRQDTDLSEAGVRQAELLADRLCTARLDAIYASGLLRAVHTASVVAAAQPQNGAHNVCILPLLTECDVGEGYTGRSIDAIRNRFPAAAFDPEWEDARTVLPNDETIDAAYNIARARRVMRILRARYQNGERVLVVAHGVFNTIIFLEALGIDTQRFDPDFANTSLTRMFFYQEGTGPWGFDARLAFANDFSHLRGEFPQMCFERQEETK